VSEVPQYFETVQLHHFSPSQLNKPIANWIFDYVYLSKDKRREIKVGENAAYGTAVHGGIQAVLSAGSSIEDASEAALMDFDFHPADESAEKREKFRELIPACIESGVDLLAETFGGCQEEKKVTCELAGISVPVMGYIDLFTDKAFCEIKTKAPRQGPARKDGTRNFGKATLPKKPEFSHLCQVAIYAKATELVPHLAYVSADDGVLFTPENCEELQSDMLNYCLNEMRRRAALRQNLLRISTDPKVLASLTDPDFQHPFYWNHQFKDEAKELWKI